MSGGPCGRGKAPERACMKLENWPEIDRRLWLAALAPADPFEERGGERAGYSAISNAKTAKGYGRWLILFPPGETKTGIPIELPWPEVLVPHLETYLAGHRLRLVAMTHRWTSPVGDALWVSSHGSPMMQMALYDQIRQRTREGLGKDVNPHLFRDADATLLAVADPVHVRLAAPLLGHRNLSTTEAHYQQARSLSAHRQFTEVVGRRGKSGKR